MVEIEEPPIHFDLMNQDKVRWLIEAPKLWYLSIAKICNVHEFCWTQRHDDAMFFESQAQAEALFMALANIYPELFEDHPTARAVEHMWTDIGSDAKA